MRYLVHFLIASCALMFVSAASAQSEDPYYDPYYDPHMYDPEPPYYETNCPSPVLSPDGTKGTVDIPSVSGGPAFTVEFGVDGHLCLSSGVAPDKKETCLPTAAVSQVQHIYGAVQSYDSLTGQVTRSPVVAVNRLKLDASTEQLRIDLPNEWQWDGGFLMTLNINIADGALTVPVPATCVPGNSISAFSTQYLYSVASGSTFSSKPLIAYVLTGMESNQSLDVAEFQNGIVGIDPWTELQSVRNTQQNLVTTQQTLVDGVSSLNSSYATQAETIASLSARVAACDAGHAGLRTGIELLNAKLDKKEQNQVLGDAKLAELNARLSEEVSLLSNNIAVQSEGSQSLRSTIRSLTRDVRYLKAQLKKIQN